MIKKPVIIITSRNVNDYLILDGSGWAWGWLEADGPGGGWKRMGLGVVGSGWVLGCFEKGLNTFHHSAP